MYFFIQKFTSLALKCLFPFRFCTVPLLYIFGFSSVLSIPENVFKLCLRSFSNYIFYQADYTCVRMPWWMICNVALFRGPISLVIPLWSGVAFHVMWGQIFIFDSSYVNALMYSEDIFLNNVMLDMPLVGADSLFMQDNMRPCVAWQTIKFLEEVEIAWFEWSTCSPDLNPIESHLEQARQMHLSSYSPSKSPQYFQNCFARKMRSDTSMPSQLQAAIRAHRGNTHYWDQFLVTSIII